VEIRTHRVCRIAVDHFSTRPGHAGYFEATLLGSSEVPANASPGTGFATVIYDSGAHTMDVNVIFSGLLGTTTASHIHCCGSSSANFPVATQVPTFSGFPLGVTAGSYSHLFDMTQEASYNPTFFSLHGGTAASAEFALLTGMTAGNTYFNIHTQVFPGGAIRGTLIQQTVPEPSTLALLGLSVAAQGVTSRRRMGAELTA